MNQTQGDQGCAWCGKDLPCDGDDLFGLRTRYRKPIPLGDAEVKCVPISIVHLGRVVPGLVRRHPYHATDLDLTFRTCSQSCAQVLHATLHRERQLFSRPAHG